jgi:phage tail-like protein
MLDVGGGTVKGYFTEISGIGSESEVVEHKIVGPDGKAAVQKIPGRLKYTDVTLKRGITAEMDIWKWRDLVDKGDTEGARKNCSIFMLDREYSPVAQWDLVNAWPTKVSGPQLQADSSAYGIEEVTITYEGFERVS